MTPLSPEVAAAILNVSVTASRSEIDTAFKLRARMSHPDRFAGAPASDIRAATAEFVRVTHARDSLYAQLRQPNGRGQSSREQQARDDQAREDRVREQWKRDNPPRHAPRPQPMDFDEFVRGRDAQSWLPTQNYAEGARKTSPTYEPRLAARRPVFRPNVVVFVVLVIVCVAAGVAGVYSLISTAIAVPTAAPSTSARVAPNASASATSVNITAKVAEGELAGSGRTVCASGSLGCFTAVLTSSVSCSAAHVTVNISQTKTGNPVRTDTKTVALVAGVSQAFVEEKANASETTARISSINC
jgi:hypothetical protein